MPCIMDTSSIRAILNAKYFCCFVGVLAALARATRGENRRPVYNIAHMVNSIYEMQEYLERGANAIEADVTFYGNGTVKSIFHGYPCDCYRICDERESFDKFLNYIRDLVNPNHEKYQKNLCLLFLDLKVAEVFRSQKYKAGEEVAKGIIRHLWNNDRSDPRIHVLLSIGHTSDGEVVRGVRDTFVKTNRGSAMHKLGFDVGLGDDLGNIRRLWSKLGVTTNRWQGDGITNCLRPLRDESRLRQAVRMRDSGAGYVDKVYDWTVDMTTGIRRSLRTGVDGILTNFPERVVSVMQEKEFRNRYRLATNDDSPFSRVKLKPSKSSYQSSDINTYVSSAREITVAVIGYIWDFYKLRFKRPGTLFPLLQEMLRRTISGNRG